MYFFIRFANIVAGSSESDSILWKLVKETKAMYLMSQNWEQLNKCEGELLSTKELMDLFVQNMNASKESNDNFTGISFASFDFGFSPGDVCISKAKKEIT